MLFEPNKERDQFLGGSRKTSCRKEHVTHSLKELYDLRVET